MKHNDGSTGRGKEKNRAEIKLQRHQNAVLARGGHRRLRGSSVCVGELTGQSRLDLSLVEALWGGVVFPTHWEKPTSGVSSFCQMGIKKPRGVWENQMQMW